MPTYAFIMAASGEDASGEIRGGHVLDPITAASADAARARFDPRLLADWAAAGRTLQEVPDGTLHGATLGEDGTITNPPVLPPPPQTAELTKVAFMRLAAEALGGGMAGMVRFEEIFAAARTSTQPGVAFAMEQYTHALAFECDAVAAFLDLFVAYGLGNITQAERDLIIDNWPTV